MVRIQAVLVPTDWYGKVCTYAVKMSLGCILYSVVVSRKVENVAYDVRVQIEIRYVSDALLQNGNIMKGEIPCPKSSLKLNSSFVK